MAEELHLASDSDDDDDAAAAALMLPLPQRTLRTAATHVAPRAAAAECVAPSICAARATTLSAAASGVGLLAPHAKLVKCKAR